MKTHELTNHLYEFAMQYPCDFDNLIHSGHPVFPIPATIGKYGIEKIENYEHLEKELVKKIEKAKPIIEKRKTIYEKVSHVMYMIHNPYRISFLIAIKEHLSKEDFSKLWIDCWVMMEFPHQLGAKFLLKHFNDTESKHLMTEKENEFFDSLPESFIVYRGLQELGDKASYIEALSWTLSLEKAKWFANRWDNDDGKVYQAVIDKKDVFAYINEREEQEIILDYTKLKDIKEVK